MSFDAGSVEARLTLDRSSFSSALSGARREAENFEQTTAQRMQGVGKAMMGVGGALTAGVTLPIVGAGVAAVKMAGDAEAATTRMGVTFGDAEDDMMSFLTGLQETTPAAMAELQNSASDAMGALTTLGIEQGKANDMTKEAMEVASNLAAQMNVPFKDALDAVQAGYAGNTDALRNLSYNMSQAEINSKAVEEGFIAEGESAAGAARAQAVHALVLEQSTGIMDAAEKNSKTFNFQLRKLWANVQDLGAEIGTLLLPMLGRLAGIVSWLVEKLSAMPTWLQWVVIGFSGLAAVVPVAVLALGTMLWAVNSIAIALAPGGALAVGLPLITGMFGKMALIIKTMLIPTFYRMAVAAWASLGPYALIIAAIAAVAAGAYLIYRNWDGIVAFFSGIGEKVGSAFANLQHMIGFQLLRAWYVVRGWGWRLRDWFAGLPGNLRDSFGTGLAWLKNTIGYHLLVAWHTVRGWGLKAVNFFMNLPGKLKAGFMAGLSAVGDFFSPVVDAVKWVIDAVKSLFGISSPSSVFAWIGESLVWGFIEGIYNKAQDIWDAVKSVFGSAVDWAKDLLGISSPSAVGDWIGRMFDLGVAGGLVGGIPEVQRASEQVAASMPGRLGAPGITPRAINAPAREGRGRVRRRRRRRPTIEISIGGRKFQQEISEQVYEQLRQDILAGEM